VTVDAIWKDVDDYFVSRLGQGDDALRDAITDSADAGLPAIAVTPLQGKLLALLVRTGKVRRILEIGTLGGYSAIWMARALPEAGELVTLEIDASRAAIARRNVERAGVGSRVRIVVGPAAETLTRLISDRIAPFDFIFIDADKESSDLYFRAALRLARVGAMIVVDNVVRDGEVANISTTDENVQGIQRMTDLIAAEPRVSATAIQTVGEKGYDGFILAVVVAP
jgi:predicted O-methyltransferase YrrM